MHKVICVYCNRSFDRDKFSYVTVGGRRYAHKECAEDPEHAKEKIQTQEEKDYDDLIKYLLKLYNTNYVNVRILGQIKEYREKYNYKYSGILKTLEYWYDIKGNNPEDSPSSIGIVPYTYEQASKYFYNLYLAQLANKEKNILKYKKPTIKTIEIFPPKPQKKKIKLLFEEEENKLE